MMTGLNDSTVKIYCIVKFREEQYRLDHVIFQAFQCPQLYLDLFSYDQMIQELVQDLNSSLSICMIQKVESFADLYFI